MIKFKQATRIEDLKCLLSRVKVCEDVIFFNTTIQLGKKYDSWLEKHRKLIEELEDLIEEELSKYEELENRK